MSEVLTVLPKTFVTRKTSMNIKPPKRSSSLVTRITRPIIEQQQHQKTISPSSSFSSSILTRGMSERMTPPPPPPVPEKSKTNRRRAIDFSRRRTVAGIDEQKFDKENIYQFSPLSTTNTKPDVQLPSSSSSKNLLTKKYYFHSNPRKTNEDLLNNSYGLTLLNPQQQQQQQRHSTATVLMISQVPNQHLTEKQINRRTSSTQQQHTLDSLEDLLCDQEVESYFYPKSSQSDHIYMNLENPLPLSYIHGTLC